jgi:hypothetical protein
LPLLLSLLTLGLPLLSLLLALSLLCFALLILPSAAAPHLALTATAAPWIPAAVSFLTPATAAAMSRRRTTLMTAAATTAVASATALSFTLCKRRTG